MLLPAYVMFIVAFIKDYTGFDGNPMLSVTPWHKQENLSGEKKKSWVPMQTFPHQIPEKRGRNVPKKHTIKKKNTTRALKRRSHNEQLKRVCSSVSC